MNLEKNRNSMSTTTRLDTIDYLFEDDIPDHLIPQDYVRKVQSKPGCVTESDFPGYRPKGAKDMDLWIESMSQDLSKECPF